MRIFLFLLLTSASLSTQADWLPYPAELPAFDYSGQRLQHAWPRLMAGPQLPYPDLHWLQQRLRQYPQIEQRTLTLAAEPHAHPALTAYAAGNPEPLLSALQNVWRLHYQGDFRAAWELGMQLGPSGAVPALYSRLMYATLLVTDPAEKLRLLQEAANQSETLLPLAADDAFARFGLLYAHARILELLDTGEATASGLLSPTQEALQQLRRQYPHNPLYAATLGGIHAGVVARVGSLIGRLTYGSTAKRAIDAFEQALAQQPALPVIYYEYAKALGQMAADDYHERRLSLLRQCAALTVYSAEEALNRQACVRQLNSLTQDN